MSCVLFSPVGKTDPIKYCRDGAMLNIARNYKPDKIYLYMSKEIIEEENNDNRFTYCIKELAKLIGKEIQIKKIERPDLTDVHLFDYFYDDFNECLSRIIDENPGSEILLNISSGTPAMKSTLQVLSLSYNVKPIQVSTPIERSNHDDPVKECSISEQWESNESNRCVDNRCHDSDSTNMLQEINTHSLIKLIEAYDYSAAANLADSMVRLDKKCKDLINAGKSRLELKGYLGVLRNCGCVEYIEKIKSANDLSEYLLMLDILCREEKYSDLMRAMSPAVVELFRNYLKSICDIDVSKCTYYNKGVEKWRSDIPEEIRSALENHYNNSFNGGYIKSEHLVALINGFARDVDHRKLAVEIRDIEEKVRNIAAHVIVSVDSDMIKSKTGKTAEEIVAMLFKFYGLCCGGMTEYYRNSYDNMNKLIIDSIRSPQQ